jgi:4-O-beta-D-mannosyl-D-glucose phosphorylase
VEGIDRKSFFAVADSYNGIDNFQFWEYPILMPETDVPDTNVYDMRLVAHEDGWIYGSFVLKKGSKCATWRPLICDCSMRHCQDKGPGGMGAPADLKTPSAQQRNVVLHPEWVDGQYAFYTRPQDSFIEAGNGGGIGFGLAKDIANAIVENETVIDKRVYHTVYEMKNGLGPAPIKTAHGWLHLAHGVRNTAAGLRYVLYMFMTALNDITIITHKPGGYFLAPKEKKGLAMFRMWFSVTDGLPMMTEKCLFITLRLIPGYMLPPVPLNS